mmetsp:Transcript_66111/g.123331  ORF Transcript_66111/g.123331 Transcript_66111/m.123331 type:complete len:146 (-) Transcript_66111:37-474(-)
MDTKTKCFLCLYVIVWLSIILGIVALAGLAFDEAAHRFGWLQCLLALAIVVMLYAAIKLACKARKASGDGDDLATHLLPGSRDGMQRPNNLFHEGLSRHQIICEAIFLPEDADLSHLTESEQKLVRAVRTDPEERDRVMWGGGLY